jgi:seryl-tRNA synthetase
MAYHNETTGAIAKAIVELSHIADMADNIADHEKLSIIATNAAAELDKLHNELNQLRASRPTLHAPDVAYASACKVCGKPVDSHGHYDMAIIDGTPTITAAYCADHWQQLGEQIPPRR